MTKIDKERIKKLSELSRIGCPEEEIESLQQDLQGIFDYVELLHEVETEGIPPCHHVIEEMVNVTRSDTVEEILPREKFLENVPKHTAGLVQVPTVIKKE